MLEDWKTFGLEIRKQSKLQSLGNNEMTMMEEKIRSKR